MLGILVILAISWALLYFIEKSNLLVLGIKPTSERIKHFLTGIIFSAILCALFQYTDSLLKDFRWSLNTSVTSESLLSATWWDIKSVLTEELLFRGALLYLLIKKLDAKKGILISALAFGVYHLFSYGAFGNLIPMTVILLGTGLMGWAWALAFTKTKSMLIPFALHLGWNLTHNTIFSKGPLGELLLIGSPGAELSGWFSLSAFLLQMIAPSIITLWFVVRFIPTKD